MCIDIILFKNTYNTVQSGCKVIIDNLKNSLSNETNFKEIRTTTFLPFSYNSNIPHQALLRGILLQAGLVFVLQLFQ